MARLTESIVEDAALAWLDGLGYAVLHGPDIAAGEPGAERSDPNYRDVILEDGLRQALVRLNPDPPREALGDALLSMPTCTTQGEALLLQLLVDEGCAISRKQRGEGAA